MSFPFAFHFDSRPSIFKALSLLEDEWDEKFRFSIDIPLLAARGGSAFILLLRLTPQTYCGQPLRKTQCIAETRCLNRPGEKRDERKQEPLAPCIIIPVNLN